MVTLWRVTTYTPCRPNQSGVGASWYATRKLAVERMKLWQRTREDVYRMSVERCEFEPRGKMQLWLDAMNGSLHNVDSMVVVKWGRDRDG